MRRSSGIFSEGVGSRRPRAGLRLLATLFATILIIAGLFVGGEYVQRYGAYDRARGEKYRPARLIDRLSGPARNIALNMRFEMPRPLVNRKLADSGLPVYDLYIAPKHLGVLQDTAEQVTARTWSTDIPREYVPAAFWMEDQWVAIEVKLRGLTAMHYLKLRPSLRLKFPKEHLFEGKKQINLSDPYDKGLTADETANWELRRYGILTWDSRFVVLRLNGNVIGVFQEIEQFGRSMADRNGRPEGFIFSGAGQLFGKEGPGYDKASAAVGLLLAFSANSRVSTDPDSDWGFVRAYFDTDRWAWAAALMAVLGSGHGWAPDNLRLFWDPARGRFEPIPWDYSSGRIEKSALHGERMGGLGRALCGIPEFRRMRDVRMWTLLTQRVNEIMKRANERFEELAGPLSNDTRHPDIALDRSRHEGFIERLDHNRQVLMEYFRSHDLRVVVFRDTVGALTLQLENHGKSFLSVDRIALSNGREVRMQELTAPEIVDGAWLGDPGRALLAVSVAPGERLVGLEVRDAVVGAALADPEVSIVDGVGPAPRVEPKPVRERLRLSVENVHIATDKVTFGPGRVSMSGTIEIPDMYTVVFAPGLELEMGPGASLLVAGDFESLGTQDAPISVRGSDPAVPWGGVAVQGTRSEPRAVRMKHTVFEGGSGSQNARTYFTAPFAVHDGVVTIESCEFRNSVADDGINLKYCDVDVRNSFFGGSADDAVDLDFCRGEVVGNVVVDSGGDGLDVSGSDVAIVGNEIARCKDKGMSIGERSRVSVERNVIRDCYTGIAVKDSSFAEIEGGRLEGLQVGVALYVKKLTFGPSHARLSGVQSGRVETKYLHDKSCRLELADDAELNPPIRMD